MRFLNSLRICLCMGLAVFLVVLLSAPHEAAKEANGEYSIKAGFVYNFARFIQWPDHAFANENTPMKVTVFGGPEVFQDFQKMNGAKVGSRKIQLVHGETPEDAQNCHIVFLARTQRDLWPRIQTALKDAPTLTIGEMNGFLEGGGIINLENKQLKIGFQVNLPEAREQGIEIGSRILKLASRVIMDRRREP